MPEFDFDPDGHVDLDAADHLDEIELGIADRRRVDAFFRSAFDTDLAPGWRARLLDAPDVPVALSDDIEELVLETDVVPLRRRRIPLVAAAAVALLAAVAVVITSFGGGEVTTNITADPDPAPPAEAMPTPQVAPELTLRRGAEALFGYWYDLTVTGQPNSTITVYCNDSVDEEFWTQTLTLGSDGVARDATLCYSGDGPDHWVTSDEGVSSNSVSW